MFTERILLAQPVSNDYSQEIEKRIFFASDKITEFKLIENGGFVKEIEVTTSKHIEGNELSGKINYLIANDVIKQRDLSRKIVWQSVRKRSCYYHIFENLVEKGIALEVGEGQVSLGEPLIKLMDYFDRRLKNMAMTSLKAKEYIYPTLIPTTVLDKCGYFNSFPHFLMFVTRLHSDTDTYRDFLNDCKTQKDVKYFALKYCDNLDYCLPPTMCFHTYHQYNNRRLDKDENLVVTSKGKSFRFESKYYQTLERLWDFTIREIVFMGSRDFVLDCRQKFMKIAFDFIEEIGLFGYCEVANDPFFASQDTAEKICSQKLLELKYELRLNVEDNRTIAVASFNFHEQFFGERFNISKSDNEWSKTGCVGFGLERLVYAFLCQFGLNEKGWPQTVIEGVKDE